MAEQSERVLFENAAYRLTASGLQQAGLTAELEGTEVLRITREGGATRTVSIPAPPAGCTGMRSSIPLLTAMYNLAIHELRANMHEGGLMLAGANWSTVWTRDIAYAAALGAVIAEPAAVQASLKSRVQGGIIMQDTGTGGGWPISTDRVVWALGARNLYNITGDREWLSFCTEVLTATLEQDAALFSARGTTLYPGETSFIDWREQSYPQWMSMADIGDSYALGTNTLHYIAHVITAKLLREQGNDAEAETYATRAATLGKAIQDAFWSRAHMHYSMYRTADGCMSERVDSLATALTVLCGLAGEHSARALNAIPRSPWGTPVFSPYKSDTPSCYHNRAVWPFQEAYVLLAHAEMQDTAGAAFSMASILRAAMAFGTNKENFRADTGEAEGTLLNSDRQLWSVSGMLGLFYLALFGIRFEGKNLVFSPCVPKSFAGSHWLTKLRIRGMELNVHINGYGTEICSVIINGKAASPIIPLDTTGRLQIEIELIPQDEEEPTADFPAAHEDLPEPQWDAPTPKRLRWHPVPGASAYYIYANGTAIGTTPDCSYTPPQNANLCNVYRVQAVADHATSSLSQPFECPLPGARQALQPTRIGEETEYTVEHGRAWLDTRPCTSRLAYEQLTLAPGTYTVQVEYCNATASRRDGDTCALRELLVDGTPTAIIPLPHNTEQDHWEDYSLTAPITLHLTAGVHRFSLRYNPSTCTNSNGKLNQCMVKALIITRKD